MTDSPPQDNSTTEEDKNLTKLVKMVEEIKNSPAMNGAFDRLCVSIDEVKVKQEQIKNQQMLMGLGQLEIKDKVDRLHEDLHNPNDGLFKKINDFSFFGKQNHNDIQDIEKTFDDILLSIKEHDEKLIVAGEQQKAIQRIAGEGLENLSDIVSLQKNGKRAFWLFATAIFGMFAKQIWPIIEKLF